MKKALIIAAAVVASGCVTTKTFNAMKAQALHAESELSASQSRNAELERQGANLRAERDRLAADTMRLGSELRDYRSRYLILLADGSAEADRMLRELERSQSELNQKERRVAELQAALDAQEAALAAIRRKVTDALTGFEGKGLTISTRDGKVYVSMEDKLLFKTGSYDIDPQGAAAVRELSTVLAANPDINVEVEGHTDDVPFRQGVGVQIRNNLDLSAMRATTVTSLILENKDIAPVRIVSSGRGESLPIAEGKSPEARQKNRRTDIILSPKLDELYKLTGK